MNMINKSDDDIKSANLSTHNSSVSKRTYLITIVIALVLLTTIWIWKTVEMNNMSKAAELKIQHLQQQADTQIIQSHEQHLKLLAKPFVWAVRSEMMQGNLSQVNLYMNEMVKEKNFQRIVVVNDKGTIVSSTNKKDEGNPFSSIGSSSQLSTNTTTVENKEDRVLAVISPVMGFNNRLGTLFMTYVIPPINLQK